MERFCAWAETGEYSHNGRCFDIGITVRGALTRFRRSGDPVAGSTDPQSAGNGSLMRLAPVPILHAFDAKGRGNVARRQSAVTHGAEEAVEACAAYADLIAHAIRGAAKADVLAPREGWSPDKVARAMRMETVTWERDQVRGSGYVIHSLEAALWAVGKAQDFREAVLLAANLGEDADTTAAIAGQLAGALWGASGIPQTGSIFSPGATASRILPTASMISRSKGLPPDDRPAPASPIPCRLPRSARRAQRGPSASPSAPARNRPTP
jgi:ADP-ribosyl-[dinitrogen reductase] hydrolase